MKITRLTKSDIAVKQLNFALSLYLQGRELLAALTLAGAADEILGKLCELQYKPSSLSRKSQSARQLYQHLWKKDPSLKPFDELKNKTRNEAKHLVSGAPIEIDLKLEAGRMIARAVENYRTLFGSETPKMRQFQRKRLKANAVHGA